MDKLTDEQLSLLDLLEEDKSLHFYTFGKLKGLKWFDELEKRGFFNPEDNPKPKQGDREGFFQIPTWDVLNYLLKTSNELSSPENEEYVQKYLNLIRQVTNKTKSEDSNYRTWWYFAQILLNIPVNYVDKTFIAEVCSKWFEDKFNTSLVTKELGEEYLLILISSKKFQASKALLELLIEVEKNKTSKFVTDTYAFKADNYWVKSSLEKNSNNIAQLGINGIKIIERELKKIFENSNEDELSPIWRPAIEDHEQNEVGNNKAKNILVTAFRDILNQITIEKTDNKVFEYVKSLLSSDFTTFKRLGIHETNKNWHFYKEFSEVVIDECFFRYPYQHELFWFLKERFQEFSKKNKEKVLTIIKNIEDYSDEEYKNEQIASAKLRWLTAIKDSNYIDAKVLYDKCLKITGSKLAHPDFSIWMESGVVQENFPVSARELITMKSNSIVKYLNNFEEESNSWRGPTNRGLAEEFYKAIDLKIDKFLTDLESYSLLQDLYLSQLIKTFSSYWKDEKNFDIEKTLEFCLKVVRERDDLLEDGHSITISEIIEYLIEGTRSDDHAFEEATLPLIEKIIKKLLQTLKGDEYESITNADELTIAINNNRGKAIKALINYSLRKCRIANKKKDNHDEEWESIKHYYDNELKKNNRNNLEFHAIITRYLPNILFLNSDWLEKNLDKIFSNKNKVNWLAAINGFTYSNYLNDVFEELVELGHFENALDEKNLKYESRQRLIKYSALNYFISDSSKATSILIERWSENELSHLVWYIWTLREKLDENQKVKIFSLWNRLSKKLDQKPLEKVLSNLNHWVVYVNKIDKKKENLLMQCAPFACVEYNSFFLIEELDRLVDENTQAVANVYVRMLDKCVPDYDKKHIIHIVDVIKRKGLTK